MLFIRSKLVLDKFTFLCILLIIIFMEEKTMFTPLGILNGFDQHKKRKLRNAKLHTICLFLGCACMILFLLLFSHSLSAFAPAGRKNSDALSITRWQMEGEFCSLPLSLHHLSPRTPIVLTAQLDVKPGDYLYVKTVYAPLQIFIDGALIFEYGQTGSFSEFWLDPPTKTALFPLPVSGKNLTLTMHYLSPSQRSTMTLHPVLLGSSSSIWEQLFSEMGFSLFFSIVLLVLGIILCLISFVLTRFEKSGISFFWLGLFALSIGIWILGECNLTGLFIQNPILLYLMAFGGLFVIPVPLIKFIQVVLDLPRNKWLNGMVLILCISMCAAFVLQLSGTASLSKTLYLFHVLILLSFCLISILVFSEAFRHRSATARRLLIPIAILTVFVMLELANFYLYRLNLQKSALFQVGMVFFILSLSILCGYFIRDMLTLRTRNRQLSYEVFLMEKQVSMQKERHRLLSETSAQLRQQRHDLKHHLAVIQSCLSSREFQKLDQYLAELSANIPNEPQKPLCENEAINAVALYYKAAACQAGINNFTIRLDIPKETGEVPESDLCVIVGNLLENGVTACQNTPQPFLAMSSRFADGILTITMDNSVSQLKTTDDHTFLSSKPGGGIGLSSIRSIAQKHHGGSRFQAENGVFSSSVYLRLK